MQVTQEQTKLTAHGMWCDQLRSKLKEAFYPLRPLTKTKAKDLHDEVLSIVLNHETTHLRVHVDALISQLQTNDEKLKHFNGEILKLKIWQFKKRAKINSEIKILSTAKMCYANAVSILTNTPPEMIGQPGGHVFDRPKGNVRVPSNAASMGKVELKVNR